MGQRAQEEVLPRGNYSKGQPSRGDWIAFKDTFGFKWLSNERVIYNLGLSYPLGPGPSMGLPHTHTPTHSSEAGMFQGSKDLAPPSQALPTGVRRAPTLSPGPNTGVQWGKGASS